MPTGAKTSSGNIIGHRFYKTKWEASISLQRLRYLVSKQFSFREVIAAVPERILFVIVFIDVTVDLSAVNEKKMAE
jgi:hypothetical protein